MSVEWKVDRLDILKDAEKVERKVVLMAVKMETVLDDSQAETMVVEKAVM